MDSISRAIRIKGPVLEGIPPFELPLLDCFSSTPTLCRWSSPSQSRVTGMGQRRGLPSLRISIHLTLIDVNCPQCSLEGKSHVTPSLQKAFHIVA